MDAGIALRLDIEAGIGARRECISVEHFVWLLETVQMLTLRRLKRSTALRDRLWDTEG
jgi:hypothetical protein